MTKLTIVPNIDKKTAKCIGTIAAGEVVEVTVKGFADKINGLGLRVMATGERNLAIFPMPESEDVWSVSGEDAVCELNLNTVQAMKLCRGEIGVLFVLENREARTLYAIGEYYLKAWPRDRFHDGIIDLDDYKSQIEKLTVDVRHFGERLNAAETKVEDSNERSIEAKRIAGEAKTESSSAKSEAVTATNEANAAKLAAQRAEAAVSTALKRQFVSALPSAGSPNIIYLVPAAEPVTGNERDEYMWNDTESKWEKIGSSATTVILDDTVTETSENGVKAKGIWAWVKGLFAEKSALDGKIDKQKLQLAKYNVRTKSSILAQIQTNDFNNEIEQLNINRSEVLSARGTYTRSDIAEWPIDDTGSYYELDLGDVGGYVRVGLDFSYINFELLFTGVPQSFYVGYSNGNIHYSSKPDNVYDEKIVSPIRGFETFWDNLTTIPAIAKIIEAVKPKLPKIIELDEATKKLFVMSGGVRTDEEISSWNTLFKLAKRDLVRLYYLASGSGDTGRKALYTAHLVDDKTGSTPAILFDATGFIGANTIYSRTITLTKESTDGIHVEVGKLTEVAKKSDIPDVSDFYKKPSGGIPKSDLSEAVRSIVDNAALRTEFERITSKRYIGTIHEGDIYALPNVIFHVEEPWSSALPNKGFYITDESGLINGADYLLNFVEKCRDLVAGDKLNKSDWSKITAQDIADFSRNFGYVCSIDDNGDLIFSRRVSQGGYFTPDFKHWYKAERAILKGEKWGDVSVESGAVTEYTPSEGFAKLEMLGENIRNNAYWIPDQIKEALFADTEFSDKVQEIVNGMFDNADTTSYGGQN